MPFYDYVCSACGHEVEVMHSVHGSGPSVCPKCGGDMKKALVAPAVHFKGSGWARKERSGGAKSDKGPSKTSQSDSSDKSSSDAGPASDTGAASESGPQSGSGPKADSGSTSDSARTPTAS